MCGWLVVLLQVLLRFPWCPLMVQCLQSMCLLDTFNKWVELFFFFSNLHLNPQYLVIFPIFLPGCCLHAVYVICPRSSRRMEWGGCWCCLKRSFTPGATLRCTTLPHHPPTPTCRPSSPIRTPSYLIILLLTCTQAWPAELETWIPSTSPSTTQPTSTQTRVSVNAAH